RFSWSSDFRRGASEVSHLAVELPIAVAGRLGARRPADFFHFLGLLGRRGLGVGGRLFHLRRGVFGLGHGAHDAARRLDSPQAGAMFSRMNYMKTALLLAALTGFFLAVGYLLGGQSGLLIALVVALGMNIFAYWNSDQMVLRMANAREVGPQEAPELYGIVQSLAEPAGLPMPRVYVIDEDQPNAFATGRSPEHAAVAVNSGLLRHLSREEVTGVLAHELGHVRNRDTLTMTVAATLSGAIGMLATFGGLMGGGRDENGRPMMNPIV